MAHCALQTARHLTVRGHEPLVVAPATAAGPAADAAAPCPVVRVPSLPLPGYAQVRVALPSRRVAATLTAHRADIVHLASPFVLGVRGMAAAGRLGIPAGGDARSGLPVLRIADIGDQHPARRVCDRERRPGRRKHRLRGDTAGPEDRDVARLQGHCVAEVGTCQIRDAERGGIPPCARGRRAPRASVSSP